MDLTASDDIVSLLEFIESKKSTSESVDISEILGSYLISIKMALVNTLKEQENIVMATSCADLIGNIFIVIYSYSLNIKLSLFICERAILLFNEYMNISNNYNTTPVQQSDIKQFIINKSIAPIILKNTQSLIDGNTKLFDMSKLFMNRIFIKCNEEPMDYIENVLEKIIKTLPGTMCQLFVKGHILYINEELENIELMDLDNLILELHKLSIKFEIFLFIHNSNLKRDIVKVKKLTNKTIKHRKIQNLLYGDEKYNKAYIVKDIIRELC